MIRPFLFFITSNFIKFSQTSTLYFLYYIVFTYTSYPSLANKIPLYSTIFNSLSPQISSKFYEQALYVLYYIAFIYTSYPSLVNKIPLYTSFDIKYTFIHTQFYVYLHNRKLYFLFFE